MSKVPIGVRNEVDMAYSWLTVHRVRFNEPRDLRDFGVPALPHSVSDGPFGPDALRGENGLRTGAPTDGAVWASKATALTPVTL